MCTQSRGSGNISVGFTSSLENCWRTSSLGPVERFIARMTFRLPTVVTGFTQSVTQLGNVVRGRGGDGKYFQTTKKGEIQELKEELHSGNKEKKKEAVKKVIAAMTIGKDVSGLFPDVVNCIQTTNIELKKLVYLYIINYAKLQPELAILAINTFRKDSLDSNPLIRALAVRTMGCIRLKQVVEYLVEPLRRACKDTDPYVRKTAATCICKLYDTSPETVEEQGFITVLHDMLSDANPTVVANAIASLTEISEASGKDYLALTDTSVSRLLTALNECSEWGQVFILDALTTYTPADESAAKSAIDRITARLSHANAAVVLSTIRLILRLLESVKRDTAFVRGTHRKLGPPLVTLLTAEGEVQYVVLRNIAFIVQKYPAILSNEIKIFFCKYNDPPYVKLEKLEILVALTNEANIDQVLQEFREYAAEIDVEFVRRTVRGIGRCAVKLEGAAERCIATLLSLIETQVNYVLQEAIVVMKDIFRRYPSRYESVISQLCGNLESLDEPEAKASMLWIIGEYAERIPNADELLDSFLLSFEDEPAIVRQQLLTAAVKVFLKLPSRGQELVTRTLKLCTENSDDPDLRDRGFIYWRLLSTNPDATKSVVLRPRPPISNNAFAIEPQLLETLLHNVSTLASVFHRPPESFVARLRNSPNTFNILTNSDGAEGNTSPTDSDTDRQSSPAATKVATTSSINGGTLPYDSSGDSSPRLSKAQTSGSSTSRTSSSSLTSSASSEDTDSESAADLLDFTTEVNDHAKHLSDVASTNLIAPVDNAPGLVCHTNGSSPLTDAVVLLSPETKGTQGRSGLAIKGRIYRDSDDHVYLHLAVANVAAPTLIGGSWAVQINKNSFGFAPDQPTNLNLPDLPPGAGVAETSILLRPNINLSQSPPVLPLVLQVAVKTSVDIFYLHPVPFDISVAFVNPSGTSAVDKTVFKTHWDRMSEIKQTSFMGSLETKSNTDIIVRELQKDANMGLVVLRQKDTFDTVFMSAVTLNKLLILFEIALQKNGRGIKITMRADAIQLFPILQHFFITKLKIQNVAAAPSAD